MNIGIQKKFQTDTCAYMTTQYCMNYVYIYVHIQITQPASYYDILDLSDISKFEDPMTTSSDEDIPALEDEVIWILKPMDYGWHKDIMITLFIFKLHM